MIPRDQTPRRVGQYRNRANMTESKLEVGRRNSIGTPPGIGLIGHATAPLHKYCKTPAGTTDAAVSFNEKASFTWLLQHWVP
jgi:hypothetical protein